MARSVPCALWVLIVDEDPGQARAIERTLSPFGIGTTIVSTVDEAVAFVALARVDAVVANISRGGASRADLEGRLRAVGADQHLVVIDASGARPQRRVLAAPVSPVDLVDAVLTVDGYGHRRRAA
jgi:DNA-binding NtrC family response regulator